MTIRIKTGLVTYAHTFHCLASGDVMISFLGDSSRNEIL